MKPMNSTIVSILVCLLIATILCPVTACADRGDELFSKSDYNDVSKEQEDAVILLEGDHGTLSDSTRGSSGETVVIARKGVYRVTGQSDGVTILIDEPLKSGNIYLVLDHAVMTNDKGSCIEVKAAEKVIVQCVGENSLICTSEKAAPIYALDDVTLNGPGRLYVESGKNGIHCKGTLRITGSVLSVQAENDGIKGNQGIFIDGGSITVMKSYEGMEGSQVMIRSGELSVCASDDGINAKGEDDNQGDVIILGGSIYIDAAGDAIDSNRSIIIEGGTTLVDGPANSRNSMFDKGDGDDAVLSISGGTVLAVGSAEKAKNFASGSQYSRLELISGQAGDVISTDDGTGISLSAARDFGCVIYSGPAFTENHHILVSAASEGEEVSKAEWDTSVPAEITDEVRALFDSALGSLVGATYDPIAVLAQQRNTYCILSRATAVYPGANPYYTLVYLAAEAGSAEIRDIVELQIDPLP